MATPYVEVITPDQPAQFVDLVGEHLVVGSAITCQVVVERSEIAREHVLLSPRAEGCYVATARGVTTPVFVNNAPFERGMVPYGTELVVGNVRLMLHDGHVAKEMRAAVAAGKRSGVKPGINPFVLASVMIVIPVLAWLMLAAPPQEANRANVPPPVLFDDLARPCPQTDPVQAQSLAAESSRRALAKAERMPFRVQDGIDAVNAYAVAAACLRASGDPASAEQQLASARALSDSINVEYRNHQFRLERALEQNRNEDAVTETRLLKNLTAHRAGAYYNMLTSLERRLSLQIDQAATPGGQH